MTDTFQRIEKILATIPTVIASLVLFGLMVMTFFDVFFRSAFNNPIEAAPELTRMSVAIIVFSSLPVLSARGGHISVDLLDGLFRRFNLLRLWEAVMSIICGVILWWPAMRVMDLAERAMKRGKVTEFLEIPTFYLAYFIGAMVLVTMVALILRGVLLIVAPNLTRVPE